MNPRTAKKTVTRKSGFRLVALAMAAAVLGGCSTYYQSYYPDSGVYYEDSGVYGHSTGYPRGGYGAVNPVVYPYWSIDYFYFSRFYHPYSVYVGYSEPLYYPYPGWALGHYRPSRWHGSLAFGFGYPWYGYGYRYPAYTFGFFSGYDPYYHGGHYRRDRHRIRHIDRRLEALQHGDSYASRRELLGRDRVAGRRGGGLYDRRSSYRDNGVRPQSRADMLRQRSAGNSRVLQRRAVAPDRSVQRRAPDVRSEQRSSGRSINSDRNRDRIRRDGGASAAEGHRGIPIEGLRGRVIVNSRNRASDDARGSDSMRRDGIGDRIGGAQNIRRAPAVDWGRAERRSGRQSAPALRRDANPTRGGLLNRSSRSSGAPPQRPDRRMAPPPQPSRDSGRPMAPSRTSSPPSRRALMRQRSVNSHSADNGRDRRR